MQRPLRMTMPCLLACMTLSIGVSPAVFAQQPPQFSQEQMTEYGLRYLRCSSTLNNFPPDRQSRR